MDAESIAQEEIILREKKEREEHEKNARRAKAIRQMIARSSGDAEPEAE
jgi:hypothetical protein